MGCHGAVGDQTEEDVSVKKRILITLLATLLTANIAACNDLPEEKSEQVTGNNAFAGLVTSETSGVFDQQTEAGEENDFSENPGVSDQQPEDGTWGWYSEISLKELQTRLGCYATNQCGNDLDQFLRGRDYGEIRVRHEAYLSNIFHITVTRGETEYVTTIALSKEYQEPEVYRGFIDENNGYIIIFNMEGYSISPLAPIELRCVLKTKDGGKTWNVTEYENPLTVDSRDYITNACFFTEQIGFCTARYCIAENFADRTFWTFDGGETWARMSSISQIPFPDIMGALHVKENYFATEVVDLKIVGDVYLLTVRVCQGYLFLFDGESTLYIQYESTDLKNWDLVGSDSTFQTGNAETFEKMAGSR